jgi:hypothetical protein
MTTTTNQRIRFMDNNLAELTSGSITYSSELAAFPGSNSINKFRSKVWKPSGYFLITASSNDKIYINDGSNKTITITAGEYTPDTLATEIQTQLNASSSGWTFDYDNTPGEYKFRFAHGSSHTLRFSEQTESVWDDLGFVLTSDETISTERKADEQRNHMYESVVYDLGYNAPIEFFSVISPLDEEFSISEQATVKLQANNLNDFSSPPLDITLSRTSEGIFYFTDSIADSSYRFWRFYFDDKYNANGNEGFSLSYIYLGDYTTLEMTNVQIGINKSIFDPSLKTESEAGAIYFDKKTKYVTINNVGIALLTTSARNDLEQLFYDFGTTTPLFISLDPRSCLTDNLSDLTKYVVFNSPPRFTHVKSQYFNMSMNFREVL